MGFLASPTRHLVELEVVTIKHLATKISRSFEAASLQATSRASCARHDEGAGASLPGSPVFLLGVLLSSASVPGGKPFAGLMLADSTGSIPCEVRVWVELPVSAHFY